MGEVLWAGHYGRGAVGGALWAGLYGWCASSGGVGCVSSLSTVICLRCSEWSPPSLTFTADEVGTH